MPNIKSAKKRVEVANRNNKVNKSNRSELSTAIKKLNKCVENGNKKEAEAVLNETFKVIDENVTSGTIHKNKANRKKAEASSKVNAMK